MNKIDNSLRDVASEAEKIDAGEFSIDGFDFSDGQFVVSFTVVVEGESRTLKEQIDFRGVDRVSPPSRSLLRLLTLACSLSYFKATPATLIAVQFPLLESEKHFLESLIGHGLAEFAYRNDLPKKLRPSVSVTFLPAEVNPATRSWRIESRPVVAVGGGKDSVVTIEALQMSGMNPMLFSVNQFGPIDKCVAVSGCDYILVDREIDPQLRIMNERGATNGHVPVTAINSLIGLLIADIGGFGPLVMSNEGSANFGNLNWNGLEVNHQWSKSLEFEDLLRATLTASNLEEDRYFSLLRSYNELEIAERFSTHSQYFRAFTSCNRVFKIDPAARNSTWCGECPKCHFVFLILAPFMSRALLVEIFGRNLLNESENVTAYEEIIGVRGNKPFECVGEYEEAAEAFQRLSQQRDWQSDAVVKTLEMDSRAVVASATSQPHEDRVPKAYRDARNRVASHAA